MTPRLPPDVVADLRTDHAGETGAVWMYRAIRRLARDAALREFAERHHATESAHLARIEGWLPAPQRSRLLPLWRVAGWCTGALPALFGPRAVYATIEAVERFVDGHYGEQIARLRDEPALHALRQVLAECQADEVAHRDEACARRGARTGAGAGPVQRAWAWMVGTGSHAAVALCRRI
jgi:ubiquinone biosynthesis monooxygenase Coq7